MLKNKFPLGDKLWTLEDNKADCKEVIGIIFDARKKEVKYFFAPLDSSRSLYWSDGKPENKCFQSKEELLESL